MRSSRRRLQIVLATKLALALVLLPVASEANVVSSQSVASLGLDSGNIATTLASWPLPSGDRGGTRSSTGKFSPEEPQVRWVFEEAVPALFIVSGDISGDTRSEVAFGTDSGLLYVVQAAEGFQTWRAQLPGTDANAYLVDVATGPSKLLASFKPEGGKNQVCLIPYPDTSPEWCHQVNGRLTAPTGGVLPDGSTGIFLGFANFTTGEAGVLVLGLEGFPRWKIITGWAPLTMALGDRDGELGDEVVATMPGGGGIALKVLPQGVWTILWSEEELGGRLTFAHIADLRGDGRGEVVFKRLPTSQISDTELTVLAGDVGATLWAISLDGAGYPLAMGDSDGDSKSEAVTLSLSGKLVLREGLDGTPKWERTLSRPTAPPMLLDVRGDGAVDIIVATGAVVQAISGPDGVQLWNLSVGANVSYLAAADVDGDGWDEILGVTEKGLVALDEPPSDSLLIVTLIGIAAGGSVLVAVLLWRRFRKEGWPVPTE